MKALVKFVDQQTDWNAKKYVRLDLVTKGGKRNDLHLYVPEGHPLANARKGDVVTIKK